MPSIDDIYSSNRLSAENIVGRDHVLTITQAIVENCARQGEPADNKVVLYFSETEKTCPLNVTNSNTIGDLHGKDYTMWGGKQITLYQTMTEYNKKMVPCIRIRTAMELGGAPAGIANVAFGTPLDSIPVPVQGAAGTVPAPVDDPFRPILAGEPHNPSPADHIPI